MFTVRNVDTAVYLQVGFCKIRTRLKLKKLQISAIHGKCIRWIYFHNTFPPFLSEHLRIVIHVFKQLFLNTLKD